MNSIRATEQELITNYLEVSKDPTTDADKHLAHISIKQVIAES